MEKFSAWLPRLRLEKPRSREPSHPNLSYEHSEIFTKDLVVYRDLGNRASPVNRDHMKRPLEFKLYTAISIYVVGSKLQAYATRPNGGLGIH